MATKLKNWTARRPIKVCCAILIPLLLFISMFGVVGLAKLEYLSATLLLTDLDKNDYFFDNYIPNATSSAQSIFWLQSEEHIRNMGLLEWQERKQTEYDDNGNPVSVDYLDLISTNETNQWFMGTIPAKEINTKRAEQLVHNAINQQLSEFNSAKTRLEEMAGIHFYVTDATDGLATTARTSAQSFFAHNLFSLFPKSEKRASLAATVPFPILIRIIIMEGMAEIIHRAISRLQKRR